MLDETSAIQARLVRRIAAGEKEALAELYDGLAAALFSTSLRILGDPHDAEEVIQDVFVQIWNKAEAFDTALGSAFHWTMSITRNRSIDRLRSRQRRGEALVKLQEATDTDGTKSAPPNAELNEGELMAVREAVKQLPSDHRVALEMAFFRGLTHAEIALATNEPLGTIKARIRRGMLKLRDTLREYA